MRRTLSILTACGIALAACGRGEENSGEKLDPTTSGTGGGHLGAGPSERVETTPDEARTADADR